MGSGDDPGWPVWLCDFHHRRRFDHRKAAGIDAARRYDFPNIIAGCLMTPRGQTIPDLTGPTCCRGLAFIRLAFAHDELRPLSPQQELHRRFWSLLTAGAPMTGHLYFFDVVRYVPLEEALELPALQGKYTMFFRGLGEFCASALRTLLDKHEDISGPDDGLYDVCLFQPRCFIAQVHEGGTVISVCHAARRKDEIAAAYSYKSGFHSRFRAVPDTDFLKRCLLDFQASFGSARFICRDEKFFEDRALSSGKAANLNFENQNEQIQFMFCVCSRAAHA